MIQSKAMRGKLEKFKSETMAQYSKELSEKDSEIQVLKEMMKGAQMQLKAKERDTARFKQKQIQLESMLLASKQQQLTLASQNVQNQQPLSQGNRGQSMLQQKVNIANYMRAMSRNNHQPNGSQYKLRDQQFISQPANASYFPSVIDNKSLASDMKSQNSAASLIGRDFKTHSSIRRISNGGIHNLGRQSPMGQSQLDQDQYQSYAKQQYQSNSHFDDTFNQPPEIIGRPRQNQPLTIEDCASEIDYANHFGKVPSRNNELQARRSLNQMSVNDELEKEIRRQQRTRRQELTQQKEENELNLQKIVTDMHSLSKEENDEYTDDNRHEAEGRRQHQQNERMSQQNAPQLTNRVGLNIVKPKQGQPNASLRSSQNQEQYFNKQGDSHRQETHALSLYSCNPEQKSIAGSFRTRCKPS